MIKRHCPQCGSSRVRRGYHDPPLLLRMLGVYQFLCDGCNLLFRGLAVPGTVRQLSRPAVRQSVPAKKKAMLPSNQPAQLTPSMEQRPEQATESNFKISSSEIDAAFERFIQG